MGRGVGKKADNVLNIQNWPPSGRAGLSLGEHRGHWSAISATAHHRPESLIIENHRNHRTHCTCTNHENILSVQKFGTNSPIIRDGPGPCLSCTCVHTTHAMDQTLWHFCLHILSMQFPFFQYGCKEARFREQQINNESFKNNHSFDKFIFK